VYISTYVYTHIRRPVVDKPHFFYKKGEAPDYLEEHADMIASADCFVLVTCEYNHLAPPGLTNVCKTTVHMCMCRFSRPDLILSLITHTLALQKLMNYFGGSKVCIVCV
jgi:hypothetical protein